MKMCCERNSLYERAANWPPVYSFGMSSVRSQTAGTSFSKNGMFQTNITSKNVACFWEESFILSLLAALIPEGSTDEQQSFTDVLRGRFMTHSRTELAKTSRRTMLIVLFPGHTTTDDQLEFPEPAGPINLFQFLWHFQCFKTFKQTKKCLQVYRRIR